MKREKYIYILLSLDNEEYTETSTYLGVYSSKKKALQGANEWIKKKISKEQMEEMVEFNEGMPGNTDLMILRTTINHEYDSDNEPYEPDPKKEFLVSFADAKISKSDLREQWS